jgi:hypothetical protein
LQQKKGVVRKMSKKKLLDWEKEHRKRVKAAQAVLKARAREMDAEARRRYGMSYAAYKRRWADNVDQYRRTGQCDDPEVYAHCLAHGWELRNPDDRYDR